MKGFLTFAALTARQPLTPVPCWGCTKKVRWASLFPAAGYFKSGPGGSRDCFILAKKTILAAAGQGRQKGSHDGHACDAPARADARVAISFDVHANAAAPPAKNDSGHAAAFRGNR